MVEHLPSIYEVLRSAPSAIAKVGEEGEKRRGGGGDETDFLSL